jgi:MFS family permease
MNFQVLVPPLADSVLGVGATGFGFLMAASGLGSTGSSLWIAFSKRTVSPQLIGLGALFLGLGAIVLAVSASYPLSLVAMGVAGAGGIAMAVTANTTIQSRVPDQLRGRVISVYGAVFMGSVPLGGLTIGWVASTWGARAGFLLGGVATVLVALGALEWFRRIKAAERRVAPALVAVPGGGAPVDAPVAVARRR